MKKIQESLKLLPYVKMTGFLSIGDVSLSNWHTTLGQAKNRTAKPSLAFLKGIQKSVNHYHDLIIDALDDAEKVQEENPHLLNRNKPLSTFSRAELTEHIEILDNIDKRLIEKIQKAEIKKTAKSSESISALLGEDDDALPPRIAKKKKVAIAEQEVVTLGKKYKVKEASDDDVAKFLSVQTAAKSKTKQIINKVK